MLKLKMVSQIDRNSTLVERYTITSDSRAKWSFFTTYSTQSKEIKAIFRKHWGVLRSDRLLGPALPENAGVIFRGARSIQGQIAPNIIDPPRESLSFNNAKVFILAAGVMCAHTIPQ